MCFVGFKVIKIVKHKHDCGDCNPEKHPPLNIVKTVHSSFYIE